MALMGVEEAVRAFLKDYLTNDFDVIRGWLTDDAELILNGSALHEDGNGTAVLTRSADTIAWAPDPTVEWVLKTWRLEDTELLSVVIEGNRAVVRARLTVTCLPNGRQTSTEVCKHLTFDGERFTSLIAYFDTALAIDLLATG